MRNLEPSNELPEAWWGTPQVRDYLDYGTTRDAGKWARRYANRGLIATRTHPDYHHLRQYWAPDVVSTRRALRQGERTDLWKPGEMPNYE